MCVCRGEEEGLEPGDGGGRSQPLSQRRRQLMAAGGGSGGAAGSRCWPHRARTQGVQRGGGRLIAGVEQCEGACALGKAEARRAGGPLAVGCARRPSAAFGEPAERGARCGAFPPIGAPAMKVVPPSRKKKACSACGGGAAGLQAHVEEGTGAGGGRCCSATSHSRSIRHARPVSADHARPPGHQATAPARGASLGANGSARRGIRP